MSQSHPLKGTVLGVYEIRERIGRGGMGEVYRAARRATGAPRRAQGARPSARAGRALPRAAAARVAAGGEPRPPERRPGLRGRRGRRPAVHRDAYVDGADLRALLRPEGRSSPSGRWRSPRRSPSALDAAHGAGSSIATSSRATSCSTSRSGRDHAYLADFGLTHSAPGAEPADGQLMGTVDYVAPEQVRGDELDGRADQYALGCLLFECLTGTAARSARAPTWRRSSPTSRSRRRPRASATRALPAAVDPVLARAMAKEPAERFDSCARAGRGRARRAGARRGAATAGRRWLVPALALALAAVAVAALAIGLDRDGATAPPDPGRAHAHRSAHEPGRRPHRRTRLSTGGRGDGAAGCGWATSARACCGAMTRRRRPCSG